MAKGSSPNRTEITEGGLGLQKGRKTMKCIKISINKRSFPSWIFFNHDGLMKQKL